MPTPPERSRTAFRAEVKVGSVTIQFPDIIELVVVRELNLPDSFSMTLGGSAKVQEDLPKIKLHDKIEAKLFYSGDSPDVAFIGELVRIEPIASARGSAGAFTVLRGYNSMHGLARGKRSRTYLNQTDKQIVEKVLQENSALKLKADFGKEPPKIKYEHVYQHNKTDLQFLLDRATRVGYFILVEDEKLKYQKRDPTPSGIKLRKRRPRQPGDEDEKIIELDDFVPRLSTSHQVTEVHVRAWNSKMRKELIGKAPKESSSASMGSETGKAAIQERFPDSLVVHWKTPFDSQEEGDAIAAAILEERQLSYVTADGTGPLEPRLKPGITVEVDNRDPQFDGKYWLTRVRHRYRMTPSADGAAAFIEGGARTDFHAKRDATDKAQQSGGSGQT
jgi:uncharacterized protein